jgi:putative ABC transport system permease protein
MTRVARWFRRKRLDRDLDKELQFHLDQHVSDLVATGMSADDARRQARIEIGGVDQVKERVRESRSGAWLDRLRCDTRDALRGLRRAPGVASTAILLIGLVIGGNTTIFSMVHGILTKPARGVHASRLVTLGSSVNGQPDPAHSYPEYLDYASSSTTVRSLLAHQFERFTLTLPTGSFAFRGGLVTNNYFETLGVQLLRGRTFTDDENRLDASGLVAVVSYRVWQEHFHGAEDVIGQAVALNGHPTTVIGVAPADFQGAWLTERSQAWVPLLAYARLAGQEDTLTTRSFRSLDVLAQLAPGVSLSAAQGEFRVISSRLEVAYPDTNRAKTVVLVPYSVTAGGNSVVAQQGSRFLAIFSIITMLTVAIVCANVANLMLARAAVRQRETAVRHSLGATRLGIVRTLLIEGLIISVAAWLGACVFAVWTSRVIVGLFPPAAQGSALPLDFTPDWRVVTYAMGLALLATIAFTLPPAMRAWRQDVLPWLKAGEQGIIQGRSRLSSTLVIVQLALAVLLLTSAGLAYRSTSLLSGRSLEFETQNLVLTTISTTGAVANDELNRALLERIRERLGSAPGVQSVSYGRSVPSMPDRLWRQDPVRGNAAEASVRAWVNVVGPDYLRVLGLSPRAGRELAADDRTATHAVAMINQNLADSLWPGQPAVGHTLQLRAGHVPVEVVGVAPNALFSGYGNETRPNFVFLSQRQEPAPPGETTFYIRYAGSLDAIAPAIGRALHDVDARIPIVYMRALDTDLNANTWGIRFISMLLVLFAAGSLVIAAIGQYAVIAFDMKRRTRDFGIRIALGASSQQLLSAAIREGLRWTAIGLLLGFALSIGAGRAFRSVLFGITPTDTSTYLGVFVVLAITSLLACYLPARCVSQIDPMQTLRQE